MPRYRIRFARQREARFVAHLDMVRAFERAIRRTGLRMSFTKGFNPHPKISFASPAPVGITALDEFVDVELSEAVSPEEFAGRLNDVLPEGITVKKIRVIQDKAPSLMSVLKSAVYQVRVKLMEPLKEDELKKNIELFMASEEINVERTKKGEKNIVNIKDGILKLTGQMNGDYDLLLEMHLKAGSSGTVRPGEVLDSFLLKFNYRVDADSRDIVRTGLCSFDKNGFISLWEC